MNAAPPSGPMSQPSSPEIGSPALSLFRRFSRRAWWLHGLLIAQIILLPCPQPSQAVWIDVDSDGDGIYDTGYDDGSAPPTDGTTDTSTTDSTAPAYDPATTDSDGDYLMDSEEMAAGSNLYNPDTDGDGITDADEMFLSGTNPISADTNSNGYTDYNEFYGNYTVDTTVNGAGYSPTDWDGDGYADPVDPAPLSTVNDPDSDGDYVPDSQDSNPYDPAVWADSNNNGINDDAEQPNADTDGDGISNTTDSNPSDPWIYNDWNYTGTNDQNEDWDGDGVSNLQDSHPNSNCLWCDWNNNGVNDDAEAGTADSDGDGHPDNSDSHAYNSSLWEDWNGDNVNDSTAPLDSDVDGRPNTSDSHPYDPSLWEDWNNNGTNDSQDIALPVGMAIDSDGDGTLDTLDSHPNDSALWDDRNYNGTNDSAESQPPPDSDGDGYADASDSHPADAALFEDWNSNSLNDSTEDNFLDDDSDGITNAHDTHPNNQLIWNDHNNNDINDHDEILITDTDGDGYSDTRDSHPENLLLWNDHNNNGTNDELEAPPDRDGDGIADNLDSLPDDFDNDGLTDLFEITLGTQPGIKDSDGDGLTDFEENELGTNPLHVDTDTDGITDFEEIRAYLSDPVTPTSTSNEEVTASPSSAATPVPVSALKGYYLKQTDWKNAADMSDDDGDSIPNAIEQLYSPLIVTPGGDLDGDGMNNLEEYNAGSNLNGTSTNAAIDFDGDGLTNLVEDNFDLNKHHFADAYQDPDGDGLLTFEELMSCYGSKTKDPKGFATNPFQASSGPAQLKSAAASLTYKVSSRRGVFLNIAGKENPFTGWFSRASCYYPWFTDHTLRYAASVSPLSSSAFFKASLIFPPLNKLSYRKKSNTYNASPYSLNGYDHLPSGYLAWLTQNNYSLPPLGGTEIFSESTGADASVSVWPEKITPAPQGIMHLMPEKLRTSCSDDIDSDGMPNHWEARYGLNFRNQHDADIDYPLSEPITEEKRLARQNYLAKYKDAYGIIKEFPISYSSSSGFTKEEWQLLNDVDPDHDGLPNIAEFRLNSNPTIPDFAETNLRDSDSDGFTDVEEVLYGTDPLDREDNILTRIPGLNGGNTTPPPTTNPTPNSNHVLRWIGPTVEAFWSKTVGWDYVKKTKTQWETANIRHYPLGDDKSEIDHFNPNDGKVPTISDLARKCVMPLEFLFDKFGGYSLGKRSQAFYSPSITQHSEKDSYHTKKWDYTAAQVAAYTPPPFSIPVTLNQGTKLTCLRIKTTYPRNQTSRTEVIGRYTFTIRPGYGKSEVFPVMLSYALLNPTDSDEGYIYSLVPVEVMQHPVTATSGAGAPPSSGGPIRFCRWLDAYPNGQRDNQFADKDRDRFQIRVPGNIPNLTKMRIKATDLHGAVIAGGFQNKTTDGDYEVDMKQENGAMVSEAILLVSDGDDDETFNGKGTDNDKNDQTLLADFGSKIIVGFPALGNAEVTFQVQQPIGTITLDMVYCHPKAEDGPPVNMPGDMIPLMERQAQKMREIYRQIGVKVDGFTIGLITFPDAWVQDNGSSDPAKNLNLFETNRLMEMVESSLTPSKRVRVGFVDAGLTDLVKLETGETVVAQVGGKAKFVGRDPCLVSIDNVGRRSYNVLAHETGHASTLRHNYPNRDYRLMRESAGTYWSNDSDAAKRFMWDDADYIKANSSYYVPAQ